MIPCTDSLTGSLGLRVHATLMDVYDLGRFDEASGTIEDEHKKISLRQGRLQVQTQDNYMLCFSLSSLDCCVRLGSGFVRNKNMVSCCCGLQREYQDINM